MTANREGIATLIRSVLGRNLVDMWSLFCSYLVAIYLLIYIAKDYLRRNKSRIVDTSAIFQTSEAASPPGGLGGLAPRVGSAASPPRGLGASMLAHPSLSSLILGPSWLIFVFLLAHLGSLLSRLGSLLAHPGRLWGAT